MFEEILKIVDVLFNLLCYCFLYSFKIGKFLVLAVNTLIDVSWILIKILFELLCVIFDSLDIFLLDILELLQSVIRFFIHVWNIIGYATSASEKFFHNTVEKCFSAGISVHHNLECCFFNVGEGMKQLFIFLRHIFVLFGSGVYLAVTFIPFSAWNVFMLILDILNSLFEYIVGIHTRSVLFAKECGKNIFEFLTDMPIESAIGIAIATSLIYLFAHFHVIIFSYLYNQVRTSLLNIYNKIFRRRQQRNWRHQRPARIQQGQTDINSLSSQKIQDAHINEQYCVICQERLKCILVLPCRHVCMCSECSSRLQMYHSTCPICRQDIDSSMKIFI